MVAIAFGQAPGRRAGAWSAIAFAIGWLAVATASAAAPKPKVVLYPVVRLNAALGSEVELAPAQEMSIAIREELKLQSALKVVIGRFESTTAKRGRASSAKSAPRKAARGVDEYRRAWRSVEKGERQAARMRFDAAIKSLRGGIDGLAVLPTQLAMHSQDYDRYVNAQLLLAISLMRRGRQSEGVDVLERIARLRPSFKLSADAFPPIFLTMFDEVKKRARARQRGSLKVVGTAGAEVLLNGRKVGATPLLINDILPGENQLVLRSGSGEYSGEIVVIRGGKTIERRAVFKDAPPPKSLVAASLAEAIAGNVFDSALRQQLKAAAKSQGGDYVVVLAMGVKSPSSFTLGGFIGNTHSGRFSRLMTITPDRELLSASIEANALVGEIRAKLRRLGDIIEDSEVHRFVEDHQGPVPAIAPASATSGDTSVSFASSAAVVSAAADRGAGSAVANKGPIAAMSAPTVTGPATARGRMPLVARSGARSQTGKAAGGAGVNSPAGAPSSDAATAPELMPAAAIDAGADGEAADEVVPASLLYRPDLGAEAGIDDDSITSKWWFWTSAAVIGAAAGGASWYFLVHEITPSQAELTVAWR